MAASRSVLASGALLPPRHESDSGRAILGALPIAAAMLVWQAESPATITDRNALFDAVEAAAEARGVAIRAPLAVRTQTFLATERNWTQFDWSEGDAPGSRHFAVRLARLSPTEEGDARCLITLLDRTAEVETQRSMRAEATSDSLTGLANRVAFEEAVEDAIVSAHAPAPATDEVPDTRPQHVAVLVLDLTRFSQINECLGGVVGDELLITFARRLIGAIRTGDQVARIGGDQFGVLMHISDGEGQAREAVTRIRRVLRAPFRLSDVEIRVDCAIGCAVTDGAGAIPEDLIRNAQLALKRAKTSGTIEVYQPGEAAAVRRRFSIETELRRAIESDQLVLAFQPVMDFQRGTIAGFEALARWTHPTRGPIAPTEFIPVAEECGLIGPLGQWALDSALRTLASWDAAAGRVLPLAMSVNVSALQLARDDVARQVADALATHKLAGGRLTIEITESAIIRDPERAMRVLGALSEHRVTLAMDDFGTGYSSLAYLQKLPIDVLKIDRSFVMPMLHDRDSVAIVRAILSLAQSLDMRTTAEGVETEALARTLADFGCTYGQGYHYARPLGADAARAYWLAAMA